ncbi:hypothetical protein E2C01_023803 [Portunus trituberculatus]|uniref:Uncharacterized protein n=1 Tax=Portunus trituberculatus TaxID=210409 RepID=A0A5B7EBI8_PORTR|nr:hypothetical protein [Portunus trituberculatus]
MAMECSMKHLFYSEKKQNVTMVLMVVMTMFRPKTLMRLDPLPTVLLRFLPVLSRGAWCCDESYPLCANELHISTRSFMDELVYKEASVSPVRHARSRPRVLQATAALKERFIPVTSVAFVEPQELHVN